MWLTSSSIGRKFVMALTGCCLVLFLTFHVLMNAVALIWPTAYNQVCEFLGANWYALIASAGLAALFIIHVIYAIWLTLQNRAARGADRYEVTSRPKQVEWSSKNMLVLGIVVLAFLAVHLIQFWAKMQLQELMHNELGDLAQLNDAPCNPAMGTLFIQAAFSEIWTPICYIVGFVALWFHLNHGFWSMFHTVGWNNNVWMQRLKTIGCWWTTIVIALFVAQAVVFTVLSQKEYYTTNIELQEQYAEVWDAQAEALTAEVDATFYAKLHNLQQDPAAMSDAREEFMTNDIPAYAEKAQAIINAFEKQCPDVMPTQNVQMLQRLASMGGSVTQQ